MTEKRFKVVQDPRVQTEYFIYDNENKISRNITDYSFNNEDVCRRIVMLLNEQQYIIREQKIAIDEMITDYKNLEKENIELKKLKKYCAEWMGVKEENLYDVVR